MKILLTCFILLIIIILCTFFKNYIKDHWDGLQRLLIILTFFCTTIATTYSVFTSSKAIELASVNLRPWIIIPDFGCIYSDDFIDVKVKNIGKLPAYAIFDRKYIIAKQLITNQEIQESVATVIMPDQTVSTPMITIKGEVYKEIIYNGGKEIILEITIYYGNTKKEANKKKYFTKYKVKLDPIRLRQLVNTKGKSNPAIWEIEESEYR